MNSWKFNKLPKDRAAPRIGAVPTSFRLRFGRTNRGVLCCHHWCSLWMAQLSGQILIYIFRSGFYRKFIQLGNTAPEKYQQQMMTLLNFRVKTIYKKLFRIFLACENTVQPLFSRGQKKVQIKWKPRGQDCTHTQLNDHPCDIPWGYGMVFIGRMFSSMAHLFS